MQIQLETFVAYSLVLIFVIVATTLFMRFIFKVGRQLKNQKAMIDLLTKIAERQGVPKADIDTIIMLNEIS